MHLPLMPCPTIPSQERWKRSNLMFACISNVNLAGLMIEFTMVRLLGVLNVLKALVVGLTQVAA